MFGLRNPRNDKQLRPSEAAAGVYGNLLQQVRQPLFYEEMGVPDTFGGRFDLLVLHVFMVINRVLEEKGEDQEGLVFNQALFDVMFRNMDQTMREIGIGDMGVPKRMRKMMKAFNGRMHAYREAIGSDKALKDCLERNIYYTAEHKVSEAELERLKEYVKAGVVALSTQSFKSIVTGSVALPALSNQKKKAQK